MITYQKISDDKTKITIYTFSSDDVLNGRKPTEIDSCIVPNESLEDEMFATCQEVEILKKYRILLNNLKDEYNEPGRGRNSNCDGRTTRAIGAKKKS